MTIDQEHFKKRLEVEKLALERELEQVARRNPDNPSEWEALPAEDRDISQADENTTADAIEGYEDNAAILSTLMERYRDVLSGLDKLKHGIYGTCQVCNQEIEPERLEANPAARTCKVHMQ